MENENNNYALNPKLVHCPSVSFLSRACPKQRGHGPLPLQWSEGKKDDSAKLILGTGLAGRGGTLLFAVETLLVRLGTRIHFWIRCRGSLFGCAIDP
jgi:hypothetical protein